MRHKRVLKIGSRVRRGSVRHMELWSDSPTQSRMRWRLCCGHGDSEQRRSHEYLLSHESSKIWCSLYRMKLIYYSRLDWIWGRGYWTQKFVWRESLAFHLYGSLRYPKLWSFPYCGSLCQPRLKIDHRGKKRDIWGLKLAWWPLKYTLKCNNPKFWWLNFCLLVLRPAYPHVVRYRSNKLEQNVQRRISFTLESLCP